MERIKGIDVSKWQGVINWKMVSSDGIEFAMIRVGNRGLSQGTITKDAYFDSNMQGALSAGLKVGVYFFSSSINEKEAIEEANFVIENIKKYELTMPVVFDFEGFNEKQNRNYGMTKAQITNNCIAFQNIIKSHGYTCMLYGSREYISKKFDLEKLTEPLWVARYASSTKPLCDEKYFPKVDGYQDRIAMWQYASCGKVNGINANCDMNYMYIDVSTKQNGGNGMTQKELDSMKGVVTLSLRTDGNLQIAKNFKVKEMRCKDGTDKILCNVDVVRNILQPIRDWAGASVNINSAYRTQSHNAKVGGDKNSTHMTGNAFDIKVTGKTIHEVARKAEELGAVCILVYENQNFVHIGYKNNKDYRVKSKLGKWTKIDTFLGCPYKTPTYTLYKGRLLMSKEYVKWLQWHLQQLGFYLSTIDGKWGPGTTSAYEKFQRTYPETGTKGLPDGKVGPKAVNKLKLLVAK